MQETGPGDLLIGVNLRMSEFTAAVARAQVGKLEQILGRTRQLQQDLVDLIPVRVGMQRRRLHDPAGDCATVLVHQFDDVEAANEVARGLGTPTLVQSLKHW
jgi:dTDP-4-amino-4,6-dideoxygalactose transaminase